MAAERDCREHVTEKTIDNGHRGAPQKSAAPVHPFAAAALPRDESIPYPQVITGAGSPEFHRLPGRGKKNTEERKNQISRSSEQQCSAE
eukprot:408618-Rhodomonas_salina.2